MHPNQALFANEAFYLAFNQKDMDAMQSLWADSDSIICLHPGWPALIGRKAVLDSWAKILANTKQSPVQMYAPHAVSLASGDKQGGNMAAVVCYEQVGTNVMVATNLYVMEAGVPKLMHHQSGPCGDPPPSHGSSTPTNH